MGIMIIYESIVAQSHKMIINPWGKHYKKNECNMVPLWSFGKPCLTIKKKIYIRSKIIYKKVNKTMNYTHTHTHTLPHTHTQTHTHTRTHTHSTSPHQITVDQIDFLKRPF